MKWHVTCSARPATCQHLPHLMLLLSSSPHRHLWGLFFNYLLFFRNSPMFYALIAYFGTRQDQLRQTSFLYPCCQEIMIFSSQHSSPHIHLDTHLRNTLRAHGCCRQRQVADQSLLPCCNQQLLLDNVLMHAWHFQVNVYIGILRIYCYCLVKISNCSFNIF